MALLKNVFPKFESSTINIDKLYNNLSTSTFENEKKITQKVSAFDTNEFSKFQKDLDSLNDYQITQTKLPIENFTQENPTQLPTQLLTQNQITPIPQPQQLPQQNHNQHQMICNNNLSHVMNCSKCRTIIIKQLNIHNDRLRNEELLELFSYIVFSIFILMLVDFIKKI